jgi:hypothetical protein
VKPRPAILSMDEPTPEERRATTLFRLQVALCILGCILAVMMMVSAYRLLACGGM